MEDEPALWVVKGMSSISDKQEVLSYGIKFKLNTDCCFYSSIDGFDYINLIRIANLI